MTSEELDWLPIDFVPRDDQPAWILWWDGRVTQDFTDHDGTPEWWRERGATHWTPLDT